MNREVNINNNKKRLKLYYGLLITVLCIIGVSFAWFRLYLSQSENNTLTSRTCFNTTLTEDTSKITLTDAFPITDEEGLKQAPFTFTLKNNCDSYVQVYITIDSVYRTSTNTSYLKDNYLKVNISPKDTTENESVILGEQTLTELDNNNKGYIIVNTGLKANEEKSYNLRIWMDSSVTTEQGLNKSWAGKIVVVSNASYQPLREVILTDNVVSNPLTVPGKEVSLDNETVLATAEDDYGVSYYFRGNVRNNYVAFANMCWRIVRILGNGSVKLVLSNYNGSSVSNPCSSTLNSNTAAFARYSDNQYKSSFNSANNDSAYVGFMYGNVGSSTYEETHANINKSTILTNLESWYENKMIDYEDKLSDVIWCNDKSTFSFYSNGTQCAYENETCFGAYNRLNGGDRSLYASPSLVCPFDDNGGKLSKFTVNDTKNGNGTLTYKIGLLTADEVVFAGFRANDVYEANNYLVENADYWWWTMSPKVYYGSDGTMRAREFDVSSSDGRILGNPLNGIYGLRPAIALVPEIKVFNGTGTAANPYVVG